MRREMMPSSGARKLAKSRRSCTPSRCARVVASRACAWTSAARSSSRRAGADQLRLGQALAAVEVDLRQFDAGFGFGVRGLGLAQLAVERAVVELEQHLAAAHRLADIDVQRGHAQAD